MYGFGRDMLRDIPYRKNVLYHIYLCVKFPQGLPANLVRHDIQSKHVAASLREVSSQLDQVAGVPASCGVCSRAPGVDKGAKTCQGGLSG